MRTALVGAHGVIGKRLDRQAIHIDELETLREGLVVGETYRIKVEHKEDGSGRLIFSTFVPMKCVGTYPHIASFVPIAGLQQTVSYTYVDLWRGYLKEIDKIIVGLPDYEYEEEEVESLI